ncbi:MAG TPA: ETEC_3214 domain-containing protein [Tepidisphaeraceae bacterium]|jgi:hypothetical protein
MRIEAASLGATLGVIAAVVTILGVLIGLLLSPIRRIWRRATRHRRLNDALRGLSCGRQLQTFTNALGQEPDYRWQEDNGTLALYVLDDVYVQAATDRHGNVSRFDITTRSQRFTPRLSMGNAGDVILGRTTYGELPEGLANGVLAWVGARRWSYAEAYYFGNPGYYQTWVVASNDAGVPGASPQLPQVIEALNAPGELVATFGSFRPREERVPPPDDMPHCWYTRPPIAAFRAETAFNTLSVSGRHLPPDPNPGPDHDHVRVFERPFVARSRPTDRVVYLAVFAALLVALVALVLVAR